MYMWALVANKLPTICEGSGLGRLEISQFARYIVKSGASGLTMISGRESETTISSLISIKFRMGIACSLVTKY